MKNITLILLLLIFSHVSGQSCKYQKNEVDEFTKKEILITKEKAVTKVGMGLGVYMTAKGLRIDGAKSIELNIFSPSIFTIQQGGKVMFMTKTKEVIETEFLESSVADYAHLGQVNVTIWHTSSTILLSSDLISRLQNAEITKVRWYTADGYVEKEVKKKQYKNLASIINCIL